MTHETRRGLRVFTSLLHISIQLLLTWVIIQIYGDTEGLTDEQVRRHIHGIVSHLGLMFAAFFIYYSVMQMLHRRNVS